jgi:subtilisin family serine protease
VYKAPLMRMLLAAVLATAGGIHHSRSQEQPCASNFCPPPNRGPADPGGGSGHNNVGWFVLGGVVALVASWAITRHLFPDPPPPPPRSDPPPGSPGLGQAPRSPTPPAPRLGGGPKGGGSSIQAGLRRGFDVPATGAPFVLDEVILDIASSVPTATLDAIASRHDMTRVETVSFRLTGRTLHRWRINGGTSVPDMIQGMNGERQVAGAGANFIYSLAEEQAPPASSDQYAPGKLKLAQAHRLAKGSRVLVAVIDSQVDAEHPDLADAIAGSFEAAGGESPHSHGTGMAGAIAARRTMLGTAPAVGLLTVNAFSMKARNAEGTTFNILKGLDWAVEKGARVVNMSFAGPSDPRLREALAKASRKGVVLIAAAGNAGPRSPPLFPAADPNVIAVTATDVEDAVFSGANRGEHVAVAAPGVEILAPAPDGTYQFTTGTSVASAEVSGIAALLLERNPALTPSEVRRILIDTAQDLGPKGRDRDFGAGLVNALKAVSAAKSANRVSSR